MTSIDQHTLISRIAQRSDSNEQTVLDNLNALVEVVTEALAAGEKVNIGTLGTFTKIVQPERVGRIPGTDQPLVFPASYLVNFDAAKALKASLNKTVNSK